MTLDMVKRNLRRAVRPIRQAAEYSPSRSVIGTVLAPSRSLMSSVRKSFSRTIGMTGDLPFVFLFVVVASLTYNAGERDTIQERATAVLESAAFGFMAALVYGLIITPLVKGVM